MKSSTSHNGPDVLPAPALAPAPLAEPEEDEVIEDDWNLPMEFNLFAQHETFTLQLGQDTANNNNNNGGNPAVSLKLECVERLTPLDMIQLSDGTHDATGHCVWMGGILLARMIEQPKASPVWKQVFANKPRVIELGCGTGIGGLALLVSQHMICQPSHVCFTDADPHVLELCRRNCLLNFPPNNSNDANTTTSSSSSPSSSSTVWSVKELTWGQELDQEEFGEDFAGSFQVVLATDVLYDIGLLPALFQTAYACLFEVPQQPKQKLTKEDDEENKGYFVLSHVPRACYNSTDHPPVANLEQYIIGQAQTHGFELYHVIRPSDAIERNDNNQDYKHDNEPEPTTQDEDKEEHIPPPSPENAAPPFISDSKSLQEMQLVGAAIFIFQKKDLHKTSTS